MEDSLVGLTLDNYRILSRLGEGKAGVVYMATPAKPTQFASPGTPLALKVYKPEILKKRDEVRRIENEAKIGSQLSHPNLVRIYDYQITKKGASDEIDQAYLVMEYVDGITLGEWLSMFHRVSNSLMVRIISQITDAIECLHSAGAIHRDVKPTNVLISSDFQAKLADFGVIKFKDGKADDHTPTDDFLGTIRNASPELLLGQKFDHRTDLYSLGTVLYALLHGEEIFAGEKQFARLIELKNHSEPSFDEVVTSDPVVSQLVELSRSLLEREAEKRPQSAKAVGERIEQIRTLLGSPVAPLHGYIATPLTGLSQSDREAIVFTSTKIAEVCKAYEIYVYQPRKASDPLLHRDIAPEEVYRLDRSRVVRADILFVLANHPSIGVGQELEIAGSYGKPTVLITREDTTISRMATGSHANFLEKFSYSTPEDLEKRLRTCLGRNIERLRKWRRKKPALDVGAKLEQARQARRYSLEEVVVGLGISESLLSAIERGDNDNPGMAVVERLCQFYGISLNDLAVPSVATSSPALPDANVRRLELVARNLNWTTSDFLDLRDDYSKELAASGSSSTISQEEWSNRHAALEKRKIQDFQAREKRIPEDPELPLFNERKR
jgi:transcriptional regulator with XRE-family HTH domain